MCLIAVCTAPISKCTLFNLFFFWFRQVLIVLLQILLFYEFDVLMCTDSSSLYLCLSLQKSSVKLVLL